MKIKLLLALFVSLSLAGCSKEESATAPSTNAPPKPTNAPAASTNKPAARANPLTAPVDYLGAVAKGKRVAEKTVDLASLNRNVQLFQAQEDRLPKDLNELVAMHYIPAVPAAPTGMKVQYDPSTGETRMVRQ